MNEWDVTEAGYKVLEQTGLGRRVDEKWENVKSLMPRGAFVEDCDVEDALKTKYPERKAEIENWVKTSEDVRTKPKDLFILSGNVTDTVLSEKEIAKFEGFGVSSLSELDGLLAAYALTKDSDEIHSRKIYTWRSNGFKTKIYGSTDGDLQVHQVNTKPKMKIAQRTLDEKETEILFGNLPQSHINADYGFWPRLAATALKYADTVGMEIPEAKNWRGLMESYGWNGEIKEVSNWGVGYEYFVHEFNENIIAQLPDKTNIKDVKKMFFGMMSPNADHEVSYMPVIDENQDLAFCVNYKKNNDEKSIELAPYGTPTEYYPIIRISKEDAPHLFNGAVNGIMTHQSRTRPEFLALMLYEHEQIKAGKSEDVIREEVCKFGSF